MSACIPSWYLPVVSGMACNIAEKQMLAKIVKTILDREDDVLADRLFWFHRKKFLFVDLATYLPWAGPPFQILEVYSLGQFAIRYLTLHGDRAEEGELNEVWACIESDIHSASRVIDSFREFTGKPLPESLVGPVTFAVEKFHGAVQTVQRVPGAAEFQYFVGDKMEYASHLASASIKSAFGSILGRIRGQRST